MREVASQSRRAIVLGVLAALGWTVAKITIPLLALRAVDRGIDPYDRGALMRWSIAVVVATVFVGGFTAYRRYAAFKISLRAEAELRRRLFDQLQRLHFGYHDRAQIGELMARASIDANVEGYQQILRADPEHTTAQEAMDLYIAGEQAVTPSDVALVQAALTRSTGPCFTVSCGCASSAVQLGIAHMMKRVRA